MKEVTKDALGLLLAELTQEGPTALGDLVTTMVANGEAGDLARLLVSTVKLSALALQADQEAGCTAGLELLAKLVANEGPFTDGV